MRYLPLTDTDRTDMLERIGASSIDDLFVDVPEVARLDGPIRDLPMHASEMAVERHMKGLASKNLQKVWQTWYKGIQNRQGSLVQHDCKALEFRCSILVLFAVVFLMLRAGCWFSQVREDEQAQGQSPAQGQQQ